MEKKKQENILDKAGITFHKRLSFKLVIIGMLVLLLLIPKMMILGLIHERQASSNQVINEVMDKWSGNQTISGPLLLIPYKKKIYSESQKEYIEVLNTATFLPKQLNIDGDIKPKKLKRSIYQVHVYESTLNVSGFFDNIDLASLQENNSEILWDKAQIQLGIKDLRGISKDLVLEWGDEQFTFSPGMKRSSIGNIGVSIPLSILKSENLNKSFKISLDLKGSQNLMFSPLGEKTSVKLSSSWNDPGFMGNFLPTDRKIDDKGFKAEWNVLHFNRNYPQQWTNSEATLHKQDISNSTFGVELVSLAGHYQKNTRSAKYAILIIIITFIVFFIYEVFSHQRIHPFQYIMVGSAIIIFYLLLLSFSEHLGFNIAYLLATAAIIILVFLYSRSFMPAIKNSIGIGLALAFCYVFIFVLLQLESYALLVGSIGMFALLALLMYATKGINWYKE